MTKFRESITIRRTKFNRRQIFCSLPEEKIMFQVSEKAGEKLQEFLQNVAEVQPVRLMLTEGG
ncbi:hypothetical cytosolic protein [Syntrophus aciditrophicus SB]|uniref:Hypothetical cytosolic protein n=1 Tax=Syntrophus aciditrophicus (strain SB) TaxID=56780 RepID=Q2LRN2_SYNAS|nr:hypothetical cytosolic protein [Syntrophus aciditrophicus SB]